MNSRSVPAAHCAPLGLAGTRTACLKSIALIFWAFLHRIYLCLPLTARGGIWEFSVSCYEASGVAELEIHTGILERISELSSMWLVGFNLLEHLENESIRDGLTNLFNRRFMEISLERELRLASRKMSALSLLMLDIDHFKLFNDTFGHEAGDGVLRGGGEILLESVRSEDIACRYGGEEFLVILPATDAETAVSWVVTVSIGVSAFPQAGKTVGDLVAPPIAHFMRQRSADEIA